MKYYLIAGEASGDLHGSNLMKGLKKVDPNTDFRFWGGDKMAEQGGALVKHYKDHNIMGFWEVLVNIRKISKNFRDCRKDLIEYNPDVLILIDYPGFNLRMAKFAKQQGIKVFYYISPKIWAWKESRIKMIKAYVDRMFIIFPFEKDFYNKHNYKAEFHGNPLIDAIDEKYEEGDSFEDFIKNNELEQKPIVAVLPGSRKQEIERNLSVMLAVITDFPDYQFIIAGLPSIDADFYKKYTQSQTNLHIVFDKTYDLLRNSSAAIITSGTATLEAALFNVPLVVCYKANNISYHVAKHFIKVRYISLVNLNMNEEVVKELIQNDMNKESIKSELNRLLNDTNYRNRMIEKFRELRQNLGDKGASVRVAEAMYKLLKSNNNNN